MAGNKQAARAAVTEDARVELNDEAVRDYLSEHHDFLQRHPDMLDYLHISHPSGSAISLVERQVSVLRERNVDIRHRLTTLTNSARANDKLFEQTSALVLRLLEADSVEELYNTFTQALAEDFDVEFASMILYGEEGAEAPWRVETREDTDAKIGSLFRGNKDVCGTLREEEFTFLFPGYGKVGSAAIVPLCTHETLGLIAVGSADASRYSGTMGTLFLSHIADVICRLLPRLHN
ncbi:MAG: DUF484 family protein [Halioglobus sp.]|nr:DUF484 family protein [Halioglobus sp.]